jgi:hypothetical protein
MALESWIASSLSEINTGMKRTPVRGTITVRYTSRVAAIS